jgi:hypothetical protein
MGKYSNYDRKPRDFYPTPREAVLPLLHHLPKEFTFVEPCAGNSALTKHIEELTNCECLEEYDLEPQHEGITTLDARDLTESLLYDCDLIITNPPWTRAKKDGYLLHHLIEVFSDLRPTWLLIDANWANTVQAGPIISQKCCKIQAIGRVKWFGNQSGKEDASWYLFDKNKTGPTEFYGRQPLGS